MKVSDPTAGRVNDLPHNHVKSIVRNDTKTLEFRYKTTSIRHLPLVASTSGGHRGCTGAITVNIGSAFFYLAVLARGFLNRSVVNAQPKPSVEVWWGLPEARQGWRKPYNIDDKTTVDKSKSGVGVFHFKMYDPRYQLFISAR